MVAIDVLFEQQQGTLHVIAMSVVRDKFAAADVIAATRRKIETADVPGRYRNNPVKFLERVVLDTGKEFRETTKRFDFHADCLTEVLAPILDEPSDAEHVIQVAREKVIEKGFTGSVRRNAAAYVKRLLRAAARRFVFTTRAFGGYEKDLFPVAMAILHDESDARDVLRRARTKVGEKGIPAEHRKNPENYFKRVVRTTAIDDWRRDQKLVGFPKDSPEESIPDTDQQHPASSILAKEIIEIVKAELETLDEVENAILFLRFHEQKEIQQIAAAYAKATRAYRRKKKKGTKMKGTTSGSVRGILARTLKRLRAALEKKGFKAEDFFK